MKERFRRLKIVRFITEDEPEVNAWFHKWQTVFWIGNIPPAILWLAESVQYLVFLSLAALIIGSIVAMQQAKGEIKMDKIIEKGKNDT